MEPADRKRLNRFGISALLSLLILMAGFWLYPIWLKSRPEPAQRTVQEKIVQPHDNIELKVTEQINEMKLSPPLASKKENGLTAMIYLSKSPIETAGRLQENLEKAQIEAYAINIDGIDAELRIFNGSLLTHQILFTPSIDTNTSSQKTNAKRRERPLVAVIVSGLGEKDMLNLSRFQYPLTLAIQPYQPFSLRLAQDAGIHHHEIMIDLRNVEVDVYESINALPYVSGLLTSKQYPKDLIPDFFTNAFPSEGVLSNRPYVLPTQIKGNHGATKLLARSLQIATQQGFVSIMIDASDPDLYTILSWMEKAKKLGYRLVFASEASRQKDVKGSL